jgi:hypothetical protein
VEALLKKYFDSFFDGFPSELKNDVLRVIKVIHLKKYGHTDVSEYTMQYTLNGQQIAFPYRVYFDDVADIAYISLSPQQKMILHCIYSRNNDGFVRQKHLQLLLQLNYQDWTIPYIVKVCDEYVVEIIEMIYFMLKEQDTMRFKQFCMENAELTHKSYTRMISYWNAFYRDRCYRFHEYIGRKLFRDCFGYSRSYETIKLDKKRL